MRGQVKEEATTNVAKVAESAPDKSSESNVSTGTSSKSNNSNNNNNNEANNKNKRKGNHSKHAKLSQSSNNQHKQQQQQQPNTSKQSTKSSKTNQRSKQVSFAELDSSSNSNQFKVCTNLEEYSLRAQELKEDINNALEKQTHSLVPDQVPIEVLQLRESILDLSDETSADKLQTTESNSQNNLDSKPQTDPTRATTTCSNSSQAITYPDQVDTISISSKDDNSTNSSGHQQQCNKSSQSADKCDQSTTIETAAVSLTSLSDTQLIKSLDKLTTQDADVKNDTSGRQRRKQFSPKDPNKHSLTDKKNTDGPPGVATNNMASASGGKTDASLTSDFEPLNSRLDSDSKFLALKSSLQKHFVSVPHLLEPICMKLVQFSDLNDQLVTTCERHQSENEKSQLIKQKLENLCRELQKSNNLIRIESIDLIKAEQSKAKEQTTKIQSTLSGVIKLFDENQQRNMNLRQENLELQSKLKSLLEHCDNWEKSVSASIKQRDIENRLIKTELAKANLIKNEEREKFLGEKKELLHVLSLMQEQQHRIEGQEAKLRSDLSSYASKYDECQAVISKGMSKFQAESKRMLKQLEKSRQDYVALLSKYEVSNKRIAKLLDEKQSWERSLSVANKKIETLEKLCRALRADKTVSKSSCPNGGQCAATQLDAPTLSEKGSPGLPAHDSSMGNNEPEIVDELIAADLALIQEVNISSQANLESDS